MPAGPSRIGHYEVLELIGVGGMGEVLRARDSRLGREVALKKLPDSYKLDPERSARFEHEARLLASLNHPNIATLHGIEEVDGVQALVLELVEGHTLAERLRDGPLQPVEALAIAEQIAAALDAAHERGIVHRDLKPSNLKIRPDGTVKLLDFGLAKAFAPQPSDVKGVDAAVTMLDLGAGEAPVVGTPAYMSPEQARGDSVDRRTDIWAFGCVLFEMLAGRPAFSGERTADVIARVLEREPDLEALPTATPPAVRRLIERCLAKDPNRRLRDIADARADLRDAAGLPAGELAPGTRTAAPWLRRAAIAAALAIAAAGVIALSRLELGFGAVESRQFVLVPPAGTTLLARTPPFAVSPDGERLVFSATDNAERTVLWVQELDSIDARPLPGTDNATNPFWSPNGRDVGFFAGPAVRTVPVAGGAPKTIAEFPDEIATAGGETAGGTWGANDQIVFAPTPKSRLYRVAAAGGTPEPVTELAPGDVGHVRPQFLPGGRRLLYLVLAEPVARRGIHIGSLDSFESRLVLPTVVKAVYAAPGYVLYVRDGRLKARAFDATAGAWASDDELPVADSVDHITTDGRASFDASGNGTLVYRESGILTAVQPIIVDSQGTTLARVGAPGDYQTLSGPSANGVLVVETHDLRTATGDLWSIDLASGATRQLTFDGVHHNAAVWSPTNTELVFTGRPGGVRNLHLMDVASGVHEPLLASGPDRNPTDWSRDGRHILYEESGPGTNYDLWALEMPARTPIPLLRESFNERGARLAPNGRFMAYVSDRLGRSEVYVRPFLDRDTGNEVKVSVTGGFAPRWSDDGRRLFFYGLDGAVLAIDVDTTGPFVAGRPQQLFAADMRVVCGRTAALRCPAPPVSWEVLGDDRFLLNPSNVAPAQPTPPIRVIENWASLLSQQAKI